MLIKILVNVQIFCKFLLQHQLLFLFFICTVPIINYAHPDSVTTHRIDAHTYQIIVHFNCTPTDFIYYDYLTISIDSPNITIDYWHASIEPTTQYILLFKQSKKIYTQPFIIHISVRTPYNELPYAYLHITYFQHSHKKIEYALFTIGNAHTKPKQYIEKNNNTLSTNPTTNTCSKKPTPHIPPPPYYAYLLTHARTLYMLLICMLIFAYGITVWQFIRKRILNIQLRIIMWALSFSPYITLLFYPAHLTYWVIATMTLCLPTTYIYLLSTRSQSGPKTRSSTLIATICCMAAIALSLILYAHAWQATYLFKQTQAHHSLKNLP